MPGLPWDPTVFPAQPQRSRRRRGSRKPSYTLLIDSGNKEEGKTGREEVIEILIS